MRLPFARALLIPARTHSTISERASSAKAPRTVKTILPAGVEVSICAENETKSIPNALNVPNARTKWETERANLKAEIANLARAVAEGHRSAALLDELGKRERELDSISEELLAVDGRGLDARLQEIEAFVHKRMEDIRGLLFADVPWAKAELSKHYTAITLTPEASSFRISGDWSPLADVRMVPGARIELATPAFSGRRSTTELPRHLLSRNCMGCDAIVSIQPG